VWSGGERGEPDLLARAYRNSLALAAKTGVKSVSFPSISTGAYRFPIKKAAAIALATVIEFAKRSSFDEVRFVLFSPDDLRTYTEALSEIPESKG
jgi:O-acetyl-ADP-ribose deacetylase (regulator of RNase III)